MGLRCCGGKGSSVGNGDVLEEEDVDTDSINCDFDKSNGVSDDSIDTRELLGLVLCLL